MTSLDHMRSAAELLEQVQQHLDSCSQAGLRVENDFSRLFDLQGEVRHCIEAADGIIADVEARKLRFAGAERLARAASLKAPATEEDEG